MKEEGGGGEEGRDGHPQMNEKPLAGSVLMPDISAPADWSS